jgi:hypothetical protein
MTLRYRRSVAAWIALSGMALNAVWPVLANARPSVPASASEICSATGLKHAGGEPAGAPEKGPHPSHCTLCPCNAAQGAAIPATAAASFARTCAEDPRSVFSDTLRLESPLDRTAPPRAPPLPS